MCFDQTLNGAQLSRTLWFYFSTVILLAMASPSVAQTTATYIGPSGGSWSNPANWDIGVVPINSGANTYNVIVPSGKTILFDISGANTIAGLNLQDTGRIDIGAGQSLSVSGFTSVAGIVYASGFGSGFNANSQLTVFQPSPELHVADGAVINVAATNYLNSRPVGRSFISALGNGSQLNLQSITNFAFNGDDNSGGSPASVHTVEAGNNGSINLSGVQNIDGAFGNDSLRFWIHSGGAINLQSLTTITKSGGSVGRRTLFDIAVPVYGLPALQDAEGTEFVIHSGNTVNLPSLTNLRDSILDLPANATFVAPLLLDVSGSYVRVTGGSILNAPRFTNIQDAELHVQNGGVLEVNSSSYTNSRIYGKSFISALGSGSQLNLQTVTSFAYHGDDNSGGSPAAIHTVEAGNNGTINLSGVQSIDGAFGNDTLRFWIHDGGNINFQSLSTITKSGGNVGGRTLFDIDVGAYSLPALVSADGVSFQVAQFSSIDLPELTSLNDGILDVGALSAINAPRLTNVAGSYLRYSGATLVNTPAFTEIGNAEFHVHNGGILTIGAHNYSNERVYNREFFSSSGSGSRLNFQSLVVFDFDGDDNSGGSPAAVHSVSATNAGVIDLGGLRIIDGASGNDTLRFFASGTGRINIGSNGAQTEVVGGRTRFEVSGTNSVIHFGGSVSMADNTEMKATLNGRFEAEGDVTIRTTNLGNFDLKDGSLRMIGNGAVQSLEVISTDIGTPTGALGNIGQIGQLQIGSNSVKSRVTLQDNVNNNGVVSDREALYLQGFPSTNGLSILNGSSLILNGHDVYTSNGQGNFTSLRSLFADGVRSVAYGSGFVYLTGDEGEVIGGSFEGSEGPVLPGFNIRAPITGGGGRVVSAPTAGNPNNKTGELYAGSMVEMFQMVSTLDSPFSIEFDAWARDTSGTLSLLLDDVLLGTWHYTDLGNGEFLSLSVLINNPDLIGAIDKELTFRWDANTGHAVWLDNIRMTAIPEPGTACILLLLGMWLPLTRRRCA